MSGSPHHIRHWSWIFILTIVGTPHTHTRDVCVRIHVFVFTVLVCVCAASILVYFFWMMVYDLIDFNTAYRHVRTHFGMLTHTDAQSTTCVCVCVCVQATALVQLPSFWLSFLLILAVTSMSHFGAHRYHTHTHRERERLTHTLPDTPQEKRLLCCMCVWVCCLFHEGFTSYMRWFHPTVVDVYQELQHKERRDQAKKGTVHKARQHSTATIISMLSRPLSIIQRAMRSRPRCWATWPPSTVVCPR